MPRFTFTTQSVQQYLTCVEADTLEEAVEIAQDRGTQTLCYQCARGEPEAEWRCGVLDEEAAFASLVDVEIDGTAYADVRAAAQELWCDVHGRWHPVGDERANHSAVLAEEEPREECDDCCVVGCDDCCVVGCDDCGVIGTCGRES